MPHDEAVSDGDRIRAPSPLPAADSIQDVQDLKRDPRVYTQLSQDDEPQQIDGSVRGHCIHAAFLVGLALLFSSISATVGVLYHFSQSGGGLTTEQESRRYLWIYGPTAFIVLLRVFWRMIELKVKQSMPWHELANGPASAEKTIMLEYMSRTIFGNVWRSMKNRHWAVLMTIIGHLILLLMVVFATGLFTLESTQVTEEGVRFAYNRFDTTATNYSNLNPSPALLNFAIRTHNLSYPKGTTEDILLPQFEPVEIFPEDTTFQSEVSGLKVDMECEHIHIKNSSIQDDILPWFLVQTRYFFANISTPTCNITNSRLAHDYTSNRIFNPNTTQSYIPTMKFFACNTDFDDSHPHDGNLESLDPDNSAAYRRMFDRKLDTRILLSLADLGLNPHSKSSYSFTWIQNLTVLLCKPSYTLNEYLVEYSQNSTITKLHSLRNTGSSLPGLYPADISRMIYTAFNDFAELFLGLGGADFNKLEEVPPFFQMIEAEVGGNLSRISLKDLMDPEILIPRAEALMKSTVVQMLHANILTNISDPSQDTLEGTATFALDRLHVKTISTGFLSAGFATMAIFCVALLFFIPRKFHAEKPIGSTFAVAEALDSSPETCNSFLSGGKNLQSDLQSWNYTSHQNPGEKTMTIDCVTPLHGPVSMIADETGPSDSHQETTIKQWWRPASSHTWFTAIVVALALIVIGFLEAIQQVSDRNQGFVGVRSLDMGTTVLAQYIPAATALAISLMFGSIEQLVSAVSPFASLTKGNAPASRTLSVDYLTKSGPHVLVLSLLNQHIALSIILLSTFVASFMSIVIPGLYSHITLPESMDTTVFQVDKFDPTVTLISFEDHGAAAMLNLLTYYGIEYPQWTFDDLAIPQFSALNVDSDSHKPKSQSSSTLSLRATATRARLRCEPITKKMQWEAEWSSYGDEIFAGTSARLPWSMCSNLPRDMSGNATAAGSVALNNLWLTTNGSTVKMNIGACHILGWTADYIEFRGGGPKKSDNDKRINPDWIDLPEWGCPSLLFSLGTLTFSKDKAKMLPNSTIERNLPVDVDPDISTIACWQNLEEVEADITLRYPDLSIPAEYPPQPDESTVKWVQNRTVARDGTTFQFAPNNMFLSLNNPNGYLSEPLTWADDMDHVFQAMVHIALKEHNLTLSEFTGSAKDEMLPKIAQKLYGRYMAQALSNNWRVDFDKATPRINLTDTLWKPDTTRSTSNLTSGLAARSMPPPTTNLGHLGKRAESASRAVHAVITHPDEGARTRMVQNRKPKIALQAMLGFMAVGAILTKLLLRTKEVLPHEPYSIAGRAILVANGNMLEKINGERQVFGKDRLYRLGWWKDTAGVERYGICVQPQE